MAAFSAIPSTASGLPQGQPATALYSDEAVQAILQKALELRTVDRFSIQQLQEMAAELDISAETLAAAVANWEAQQPTQPASAAHAPSPKKHRKSREWQQYFIASMLMIGLDVMTAGALTWSIFPVFGWGLSLLLGGCDRDRKFSKTD
ncbi:MAG: 2TM domain-containing protein [Cyanobacteria bacterium P01_F01_bin.56]